MSEVTSSSSPQVENALLKSKRQQSFGEYVQNYLRRVRGGDLGILPIVIGLVFIAIIFQSQNANFLTPRNFVNLIVQAAIFTTIGYGIVVVLLLGEIDLSVGYVAGVSAVIVARLLEKPVEIPAPLIGLLGETVTVPWFLAMITALGIATLIGLLQGSMISFFQLPSFIVTVAGQLAWSGMVLILMGGAGTVNVRDQTLLGVTGSFFKGDVFALLGVTGMPFTLDIGALLGIVVVLAFGLNELLQFNMRRKYGLGGKPVAIIVFQLVGMALLTFIFIYVCNQDRGVPFIGAGILIMMIILTFVTTRLKFGRYLFAVGGNKEAARRAGIPVERIRVFGFVLASFMAGVGGIILASRLRSVAPDAGGGQLLLNSLAAPVIGGTSLYGGSGKISSAILGAFVIASVDNGMFLLGLGAGQRLILTAVVLLVAVIVDALARRSQKQSGIR